MAACHQDGEACARHTQGNRRVFLESGGCSRAHTDLKDAERVAAIARGLDPMLANHEPASGALGPDDEAEEVRELDLLDAALRGPARALRCFVAHVGITSYRRGPAPSGGRYASNALRTLPRVVLY